MLKALKFHRSKSNRCSFSTLLADAHIAYLGDFADLNSVSSEKKKDFYLNVCFKLNFFAVNIYFDRFAVFSFRLL